jgi:hypothetical protein
MDVEATLSFLKVLPYYLPKGVMKNHEKPQSEKLVTGVRFETGTS